MSRMLVVSVLIYHFEIRCSFWTLRVFACSSFMVKIHLYLCLGYLRMELWIYS